MGSSSYAFSTTAGGHIVNCYFDINCNGVKIAGGRAVITGNIFDGNGSNSGLILEDTDSAYTPFGVWNNTINNFSKGIDFVDGATPYNATYTKLLANNIISNCTTGVFSDTSDSGQIHFFNNAYYNNTADNDFTDTYVSGEINKITLSANPFTDEPNGDFTLNSTAGGGALCRAAAYPTDYDFDGTDDHFADVGALQHEDSGGGSAPTGAASRIFGGL
jgi:hypothetical protein